MGFCGGIVGAYLHGSVIVLVGQVLHWVILQLVYSVCNCVVYPLDIDYFWSLFFQEKPLSVYSIGNQS
jgi:hypothetical protein